MNKSVHGGRFVLISNRKWLNFIIRGALRSELVKEPL